MLRELPRSFYFILLSVLIVGNVSTYRALFAPPMLEVTKLEVGKGSATLVRAPGGATILIDTGPDASILRALGTALPPWQRSIDVVILTGTKKSAVGGLPDVLSRYKVVRQIAITRSQRLFIDDTYVDIIVSPNGTTIIKPIK